MTSEKETRFTLTMAVILLVVGLICYAYTASTAKAQEEPIRVMFKKGGKVLFSHKTHSADSGYGVACVDCHHEHGGTELDIIACGDCHQPPKKDDSVAQACIDCHQDEDIGVSVEDIEGTEVMKTSDAFHKQCKNCHDEIGSGPQTGDEECKKCHAI